MILPELTILNQYRLTDAPEHFDAVIAALADRVRREGDRGVLGYRFFSNATANSATAVIDYATPKSWIGHHQIAMAWPEMTRLHQVAQLTDVTFLGPLTPEIRAWLQGSSLSARLHDGNRLAAGFLR